MAGMEQAVVAFRKKPKKAARKRSRRADEDAADAADAAEGEGEALADELRAIAEVREDQRLRAQALKLELATSRAASGAVTTAQGGEYGLLDPKKDGATGQKLLSLLDGQFTGQSSVTQRDPHEELLERYIEEKLHKKRAEDGDAAAPAVSEEDALFALPDHLNPKKQQQQQADGSRGEDESASGGVLIWNTGIAEVELPASFARKTAQDTARALSLEEQRKTRRRVDSSALPANFSTDFDRHRSAHVAELKSMRKDEQRERGFRKLGKNQPGDDAAVARFRKFESRRKMR